MKLLLIIFLGAMMYAASARPAIADELELHRWCLQTKNGSLRQDIAAEVVRRLNRRLYMLNPSSQLEREDDPVFITVGVPRGIGTEDSGRVLVEVTVGPVIERENLEELLDSSLIDRLLKRNYLWIDETLPNVTGVVLENETASLKEIALFKTLKDVFWWSPADYTVSASYGFARFSDRAGLFVEFGNDELGYPLWNSGTFRAGIAHEFIKVWVQSPILGVNSKTFFVTRKLDGAMGAGAAFDVGNAGGEFGFGDLSETSSGVGLIDSNNIHYVSAIAQAYYSLSVPVHAVIPGALRLKFGGGFHEVVTAYVNDQEKIILRDRGTLRGGPYLRAEFVSLPGTNSALPDGEAFLQYYNGGIMFGGAYNILNWLGIEAKCSVIFSPDAWEPGVMYEISPRIRI